jgi:large subunit ribosomal protein L22
MEDRRLLKKLALRSNTRYPCISSEDNEMEASATVRHIRITPRKARQVIDLIRGKMVGDALNILTFTPLHAARIVKKLLDSAVANAEQKKVGDLDTLKVTKAYVNQGVTMKRMRARAMGRGNVIRKRTSHITVVLSA